MRKAKKDKPNGPTHVGKDVYLFPILSNMKLAQALVDKKRELGKDITAMATLHNGVLLVNFQEEE